MSAWTLQDKVILITGGGRGIGAATALELSRRGAKPVIADLDTEAMASTAAQISPTPLTIELDVTDLEACEAAVQRVVEDHGKLDIVWANAGIATGGPLQPTDPAAWKRTIDVNLIGAFYTVRAALPAVIQQRGYVAVTASLASFAHAPQMSAYAATKAGVEAMSNSLRIEVAQHGVDVATIHPTWIDTDMVREGFESASDGPFALLRAAMRPPLKKTYPVDRAVKDIVRGFEQRKRRICVPPFMQALHALRPLLTTRLVERDELRVAPEMERAWQQEFAEKGLEASASERVAAQIEHSQERVEA